MSLPAIIPAPQDITATEGALSLSSDSTISGEPAYADALRRILTPATGLPLRQAGGVDSADGTIVVSEDTSLEPEHYTLEVAGDQLTITAADLAAANWAAQTLRQLLDTEAYLPAGGGRTDWQVPGVKVVDGPRYSWRSLHFDPARYFKPVPEVLRFIDQMAMHKYNVLHFHLTEDQGWRFESKKYPKLNEISSWRRETKNHLWEEGDGTPEGGYYTQDQLRGIVAYAAARGINVMPEIEFPGHVSAALAAYPEYAVPGFPTPEPAPRWGIMDDVLNMTDESMQFVYDIWTEVLDIFPFTHVHIGGDEAPRTQWLESEHSKKLAAERGLPGPDHLQAWFTAQLRDFLEARGRTVVAWDEVIDEGPAPGVVIHAWRARTDAAKRALEAGQQIIQAPTTYTYFDYYPSRSDDERYFIGGDLPLEKAYSFDPGADAANEEQAALILGTSAQLWAEYSPTFRITEYLAWPRACAHAEVAWSAPEKKDWADFEARLTRHIARLEANGINVRPLAGPHPWQQGGTGLWRRPDSHRKETEAALD
ncbi:beta-N-acetylhexosaminidase [Parenemella sanctibonifatiensis]|nr:beta-N-acetylhexosaminidase [Parenemella sanctibonifatiensis]